MVPFLKNPDKNKLDPSNYRPIALLSNFLKLYQSVLDARLSRFLETRGLLGDEQYGFRPDRSLLDAHYILSDVIRTAKHRRGPRGGKKAQPIYCAFLDLRKAFDRVPRAYLWRKLHQLGIRGKVLRVIIDQYTDIHGYVKVGDFLSRKFKINLGVIQGSKLGPLLFNCFINDLLPQLNQATGVALSSGDCVRAILYADDICLLASTPENLQTLLHICENWAEVNQMKFAPEKSKILIIHQNSLTKTNRTPSLFLNSQKLEIVSFFTYLGIEISFRGNISSTCSRPNKEFILKTLKKFRKRVGLISLLGTHMDNLRPITAIRLYKSLARPILEFGAQIILYNEKQISELEKAQTKALRRLLGLHPNCRPETARLLARVEPYESRTAQLKLSYFHKLRTCSKNRLLSKIFLKYPPPPLLQKWFCFALLNFIF